MTDPRRPAPTVRARITVTLEAWEWFWLMGIVTASAPEQHTLIDQVMDQIMSVTDAP